MDNKKRRPIILALWFVFILMIAGVAYLSFQNGEDAKKYGDQMVMYLAGSSSDQTISSNEMDTLVYHIRQSGRAIAFLMIGIVGTITIHVSCPRCKWWVKTGITAFVLVAIAFLTERLKIYIPTRHYSYEEMLISISAVITGFLVVSAVTLMFKVLKGFFRMMAASHSA